MKNTVQSKKLSLFWATQNKVVMLGAETDLYTSTQCVHPPLSMLS